jgi:type IV secretory pathway VirB10-like protein
MNTIWLKIAGAAIVVVILVVVVGNLRSGKSTPAPAPPAEKTKTFYDMADRDKQFNEAPKPVEPPPAEQPAEKLPEPAAQPPAPPEQPPAQPPAQPAPARPAGVVYPSDLKGPTTLYFKKMSEEDDLQAQQILPYATAGRSMGRLPIMQYGLMMKAIQQIEDRWPDSWYNFRAKQMMEEITQYSDRYALQYNITPQRLDISRFMKKRPGTEARTVEPARR